MDKSIGTHLNQTNFHRYIKSSMQSTFTTKLFKKKCVCVCVGGGGGCSEELNLYR